MRVGGKIFLLIALDTEPLQFNAKAHPDKAIELRERYASILPGYHMNKKHWNTIITDGSIPAKMLKEIIDDSYSLIIASLPQKAKSCSRLLNKNFPTFKMMCWANKIETKNKL